MPRGLMGEGAVDMAALLEILRPFVEQQGVPPNLGGGGIQQMVQQGYGGDPSAMAFQTATGRDVFGPMPQAQGQPMPQPQMQPQGQPMPQQNPAVQAAILEEMAKWEQLRAEGMFGPISDEDFMQMMLEGIAQGQ